VIDTYSINSTSHHTPVKSLSSKRSLSDANSARLRPIRQRCSHCNKPGRPCECLEALHGYSPITAHVLPDRKGIFARARAGSAGGKPMSMHINTSFTQRSRAVPFSAHPNQKLPATSQLPTPQSATAAFPPMQVPTVTNNANNNAMRQSIPHPAEVKLPDLLASHHPATSQHQRTQSAPLPSPSLPFRGS
jgi:hypothetical protein